MKKNEGIKERVFERERNILEKDNTEGKDEQREKIKEITEGVKRFKII